MSQLFGLQHRGDGEFDTFEFRSKNNKKNLNSFA